MIYWLDANVFIQAKNTGFAFDLSPSFWLFLEKHILEGKIRVTKTVYDEITENNNDELAQWMKRFKSVICESPPKSAQDFYRQELSNFVSSKYKTKDVNEFLRSADGWVVAHAYATRETVVGNEIKKVTATKIKMPNICRHYQVRYISLYDMLRELGYSA